MNLKLKSAIVGKYGTQGKFADALGVNESMVSQIVTERRGLARAKQRRWAKLLGTTVEALGFE